MSSLEARREARRRRILENSSSRLQRITGVEDKSTLNSPAINLEEPQTLLQDTTGLLEGDSRTNNVQASTTQRSFVTSNRTIKYTWNRNYSIALSGFLYSIFLVILTSRKDFVGDGFAYVNRIFTPLLLYEVLDIFLWKGQIQPMVSMALLSVFMPNTHYISGYVRLLNALLRVVQDMMIYFFTFTFGYYFLLTIL